jgi:hypothetical protein
MKLPKTGSKPILKFIDIIYYGRYHLKILKIKPHKCHLNEGQSKDF